MIVLVFFGSMGAIKAIQGLKINEIFKIPTGYSRIFEKSRTQKPIWNSTKKMSSVENAFEHWKSHKQEFPNLINSKHYVEQTRE